MAQILVRNIDEEVVERLKRRARENGRSLQTEVKTVLEQSAKAMTMAEARKQMDRFRSQFKGRKFPDSAKLIRKDRDR
jgi:plasmid stability protein